MSILPLEFAERLEAMLCNDPSEAGAILRALLTETLELVERHQPSVDTSRVRKLFLKEYKPWQPVRL